MQHNFITTMRSLKLVDGCKGSQVYALNLNDKVVGGAESGRSSSASRVHHHHSRTQSAVVVDTFLPYGLPDPDLVEPLIDPNLKSTDLVLTLAELYREVEASPDSDKSAVYLHQYAVFKGLYDPKMLRRCLRCVRQHAVHVHDKVVTSAWLRFERREDELDGYSPMVCPGQSAECPQSVLVPGYDPDTVFDPCPCRTGNADGNDGEDGDGGCSTSLAAAEDDGYEDDMALCVGEDEVVCSRHRIAQLSEPLYTMMYGGFTESRREKINFTHNGLSVKGIWALKEFSRISRVDDFAPDVVLELLSFANRFCCERLKMECDFYLSSLVSCLEEAIIFVEYGLEETAYLLVASCLQVMLRELPGSLSNPEVMKLLCSGEGRQRLASVGHASFLLYYFLSQVAMEEDWKSNTTVMLLERLSECAALQWQKQLALHNLGCVMLQRKEYKDAQRWFEAAAEAGHVYSLAGVARAKYKRGHKYSAYKLTNSLLSDYKPLGWMYQERSLYCIGKEMMADLNIATELDPTLSFPYKYRAIMMMEDKKIGEAISEINRILGFKVSADCLEFRAWFSLVLEDYDGALRDIRAILTLEPNYMMYHGKLHADHMVGLLEANVHQWSLADCWVQLYDRWSSVDDIGSLAVVHQMLSRDPAKSVLRFRQSLLLLRLNCQKAAMRSLRLARNHSPTKHERLIYEGWILYDTGHREEALGKAEESIALQRSFEAYFLKAYALADASLDATSTCNVIELLEEAIRCPSDGLRKGQALNNLGSVYVDCNKLDLAMNCYVNAVQIRHTRAHQGVARIFQLTNQRKLAYDEMTKLIEKAQNNASAYEKRSEYCERDMARSDLMMATKLDPLRTYPYRYRAAVLMDDHKEEEALAELTRAIAFKPDVQLLHLRAQFYESMGDITSTLRDLQAALCLDPNHADLLEIYDRNKNRVDQQN